MASTATRRPPVRAPKQVIAAPAAQLPPRPKTWPRDVALLLAGAVASLGLAPLLHHGGWAIPCLLVLVVAALVRGAFGRRASERAELVDRLTEALSPALGLRAPDRRAVRARRWTQGWPGEPRKVTLRYAPGTLDDDPMWRSELVKTVNRRLLANYQVARHIRKRCVLDLVLLVDGDEDDKTPALQARAERTLKELLGPTATVENVEWNGSEIQALEVKHEAGVKLSSPAYRTRIERVVSTMLPGRWRAKWDLLEDRVRFELRPPLPGKVDHPQPELGSDELYKIPLALGEDGEIIIWNLRGTAPHMIVVGKTGQGKTVVINGVVMEFCIRRWPVRICDPKRIEFMGLRGWPNVECVATAVADMVALIYQTWLEMEHRYELIETGEAVESDFEPMLLVLDEYRDFVGMVNAWYASIKVSGMPSRCPVFEWVSSIARKGRSAGIHQLLGTQRPDADFLSGEMRDNFATRMSLGRLSPQGAIMMWEAAYIGVAVPRKPGRGTAVDDNDRPVESQAYWTPDPRRLKHEDTADRAILEQLCPSETTHPQKVIELGKDIFDALDDDSEKTPSAAQLEKRLRQAQWDSILGSHLVLVAEPVPNPLEKAPRGVAETLARGPAPKTSPAPAAPASAPAPDPDVDSDDAAAVPGMEASLDDEYAPATSERPRRIRAGDLILVDESLDLWGVVSAEPEPLEGDESVYEIEWRSDEDDGGWLEISEDTLCSIRHPLEDDEENAA